jgi:hypothetical protein
VLLPWQGMPAAEANLPPLLLLLLMVVVVVVMMMMMMMPCLPFHPPAALMPFVSTRAQATRCACCWT